MYLYAHLTIVTGIAGGLTNLSKMPACNIMLLGSQRKILAGFSSTAMMSHFGHLYDCDLVQRSSSVSIPGVTHSLASVK